MAIYTEVSLRKFVDVLFVIHPLIPSSVTGVGYDLHIGYYLKIYANRVVQKSLVDPTDHDNAMLLELEPLSSVFCITHEHIYMSNRVAGTIHTRATLSSQGMILNSTTVDPGWGGQQVYCLTNISSHNIIINLKEHFCTLMISDVKDRSFLTPRDQRAVIVKYLNLYQGDTEGAFQYVMEQNAHKKAYEEKVEKVKSLTRHGDFYLNMYFFLKNCSRFFTIFLGLGVIFLFSIILFFYSSSIFNGQGKTIIQVVATIVGLVSGIFAIAEFLSNIRKNKKSKNSVTPSSN